MLIDFDESSQQFLIKTDTLDTEEDLAPFLTRKKISEDSYSIFWPETFILKKDHNRSVKAQQKILEFRKKIEISKVLKEIEPLHTFKDIPNFKGSLKIHQHNAVFALHNSSFFAICDCVGSGKTVEVIAACCLSPELHIVICEASSAERWESEFKQFSSLKIERLTGKSAKEREHFYKTWRPEKRNVLITNYELVLRDLPQLQKIVTFEPTRLYLDESSRIKDHRTKINYHINQLGKLCQYRYVLNATVIESQMLDIYAAFDFLLPGIFGNLFSERFFKRHCNIDRYGNPYGTKRIEELVKRIYPFFIARTRKDINKAYNLQNNRRFDELHLVELSQEARKLYNHFQEKIINLNEMIKLENDKNSAKFKSLLIQKQALITKQLRTCTSPYLLSYEEAENNKYLELCKIVEHYKKEGMKVIVFSSWKETIHWLMHKKFPFSFEVAHGGKDRRGRNLMRRLEDFKKSDKDVLLATDALKRGHNCDFAQVIVHLNMSKNFANFAQRNGRIDRNISEKNLYYHYILAKDTHEMNLFQRMKENMKISVKLYQQNETEIVKIKEKDEK